MASMPLQPATVPGGCKELLVPWLRNLLSPPSETCWADGMVAVEDRWSVATDRMGSSGRFNRLGITETFKKENKVLTNLSAQTVYFCVSFSFFFCIFRKMRWVLFYSSIFRGPHNNFRFPKHLSDAFLYLDFHVIV